MPEMDRDDRLLSKLYKKHRDDAYTVLSGWRDMTFDELRYSVEVARVVLQGATPKEASKIIDDTPERKNG